MGAGQPGCFIRDTPFQYVSRWELKEINKILENVSGGIQKSRYIL